MRKVTNSGGGHGIGEKMNTALTTFTYTFEVGAREHNICIDPCAWGNEIWGGQYSNNNCSLPQLV